MRAVSSAAKRSQMSSQLRPDSSAPVSVRDRDGDVERGLSLVTGRLNIRSSRRVRVAACRRMKISMPTSGSKTKLDRENVHRWGKNRSEKDSSEEEPIGMLLRGRTPSGSGASGWELCE